MLYVMLSITVEIEAYTVIQKYKKKKAPTQNSDFVLNPTKLGELVHREWIKFLTLFVPFLFSFLFDSSSSSSSWPSGQFPSQLAWCNGSL
jgi:hypothetical protein